MNVSLRAATSAAAVLFALLLAPQAASAAVTCSYDGGGHGMYVTLSVDRDKATVARQANGTLLLVNGVSCGGATVGNVDGIYVKDISGAGTTVELDASAGALGPGYTPEPASSEIETYVDSGAGTDLLRVRGEASGARIAVGALGINVNVATDTAGGDVDVKITDVETVEVEGGPGKDLLTGQGGVGTGPPYAQSLTLAGGGDEDELHGGGDPTGSSWLRGGPDDDLLITSSAGGHLDGGPGNDRLIGDSNWDTAFYYGSPAGVHVDLGITGPQDTSGAGVDTITGVDSLVGTPYDDVLEGTDGPNEMLGYGGDDAFDGRGGPDFFGGGDGADTLRGGRGDDFLDGGAGEDTATYDDARGALTLDLGITDHQDTGGSGAELLKDVEDLIGSPFDDHLTGSAAANAIDGGAGADTIDGRDGADRLGGGAGIDSIDSRDTSADSVSCGEGPDSLATDALDTIAPDCGRPTPGGDPAGSAAPVLTVSVPRQSLRSVRAHGLRVLLTCSTACHAGGRLAAKRSGARRLGRLAPIDLAAAAPTKARVRITRAGRRALRRGHRVALVLRAHAVDGAGRAAAPVRLPVRLRAG